MDYIRKVEKLNLEGANLAENWRVFWQNYTIFCTAAEIDKKSEAVKIAIFLNAIGPEAVEVFNSFNLTEEQKKKYEEVTSAFEKFCKPICNEVYESFKFYQRNQELHEPFDNFLMEIKKLVRNCGFADQESRMLRDRIVLGTTDKQLQKRLLEVDNLNLDKAVEMARAAEVANTQMQQIHKSPSTSLNMVTHVSDKKNVGKKFNKDVSFRAPENKISSNIDHREQRQNKIIHCKFCLQNHPVRKCPAWQAKCRSCGGKNHFAIACKAKTKKVREIITINSDNGSDEFYINSIEEIGVNKAWYEPVKIRNKILKFKLDTGADTNVLPYKFFLELSTQKINQCKVKVQTYSGTVLHTVGTVILECVVRNKIKFIKFLITKEGTIPILGLEECVNLNLVKRINEIKRYESREKFIEDNKDLFEGLGNFTTNFNIEIRENVKPIAKPARRIPLAIRQSVLKELNRLEELGIIEKSNVASEWISNVVIVEKPQKGVRICIDPRELNQAIKPLNHPLPTLEEITPKLANKSIFSVLDLKDGYYQISLNEKSSKICTFSTPFGCYNFKRLPFGISIAPEAFQKLNEKNFADIPGVIIYMDDILIAGGSESEHDEILKKVIERARKLNIKFNKDKVQYKVAEVKFLGNIISKDGIKCDPDRVKAIRDISAPKNKKDLQKILGMINYVRNFVPHLSDVSQPLRELLKKNISFQWQDVHSNCLKEVKELISEAPILKAFDSNKEIGIEADASKYGLGACLMQEGRPVYFASRSLSETEQRYSQTEKELLAIVFACHKFHHLVYGKQFQVTTDHKPLIGIFKKDIAKVPNPRLQRMRLRLVNYKIELKNVPGKDMVISDLLSRNLKKENSSPEIQDLDLVVHTINVGPEKKHKFVLETENDPVLRELKRVLEGGWPNSKSKLKNEIKMFWKMKDDLVLSEGLVFLNEKIVVPQSLRREILDLLHKSHQGIEKTKARARTLVYWPGINQHIEDKVGSCEICQKYRNSNAREPYISHEFPSIPFNKICMDIFECEGKTYLVVADYFSKYLEILPLRAKTAGEIITKLKTVFATHGIPRTIVADNMPFGSHMFRKFCMEHDIDIVTTSPHYPQSNGLAERSVQTAKRMIRKSRESGDELWLTLLEFRNTPIKNCIKSPAEILMGRKQRTLLPINNKLLQTENVTSVKNSINVNNYRNKTYYDKRVKAHKSFTKNQKVWINNKMFWEKGEIVDKHVTPRSYWVQKDDGAVIRRNSYFLRPRTN